MKWGTEYERMDRRNAKYADRTFSKYVRATGPAGIGPRGVADTAGIQLPHGEEGNA